MFDWEDFLDLADVLATEPNNEAAARSAISRAYYATFHAGRDYLVRVGIPVDRSRNAHLQVQDELRKRSETIGQVVKRLHVWRKYADYDTLSIPDVARQAALAVTLARETIDAVKAFS
jgi:muconolactone delta-isomerase